MEMQLQITSDNVRQHQITYEFYDFKCAWFDENAYFEFFPLHVVYKLRDKTRRDDPAQMKFDTLIDPDVEAKGDLKC